MTLNSKTRQIWAEKIFELANIGAGALIFGQFLSDKGPSMQLTVLGFLMVLFGLFASFALLRNK